MENITHSLTLPHTLAGLRIDAAIAQLLPDYSRAKIQQWIKEGQLTLNGQIVKGKEKVVGHEKVFINAPQLIEANFDAQDIAIDVIYKDADFIIINKPVGLVVHPAAGNYEGTLLNALLYHFPELAQLPRAGIVHRLDKDTSGLLVVARNLPTHTWLVRQLQAHKLKREYLALVEGFLAAGGTVNTGIGRHPRSRTSMAVVDDGKEAITHYRVAERFKQYSLLRVNLETGRTHQIRVHMAHINHPIVGDQTYGKLKLPKGASDPLKTAFRSFKRQALHAHKLGFIHPTSREPVEFTAPLASDIEHLLELLRHEPNQKA
jgi:23S rRNA pseudouridine1911/1915/1917 synthase